MTYEPDNWVIVALDQEDGSILYKVLAGWSGGYLDGDAWRINSGIESIEETEDHYLIHGYSGSVYKVNKQAEMVRMNIAGILNQLLETGIAKEVNITSILT